MMKVTAPAVKLCTPADTITPATQAENRIKPDAMFRSFMLVQLLIAIVQVR